MATKPPIIKVPAKAEFYRTMGILWLRYEQGCHVITCERSPVAKDSRPDVLGLNRLNQLIEIEIKVDVRDMQGDNDKKLRRKLADDINRVKPSTANYLYYFIREDMVATAFSDLPEHVGILSPHHGIRMHGNGLPVVALHRKAVQIHDSRLGATDIKKMVTQQASTMSRLAVEFMLTKLMHDPENREAIKIGLREDVPTPESISPKEAIFDAGDRTARKIAEHGLDPQWRDRKFRVQAQVGSSGPQCVRARV
jgi:hypothetical protein